jgi:dTDP-4-dehydrorhamnose 3,5-epimerase-like enzyme
MIQIVSAKPRRIVLPEHTDSRGSLIFAEATRHVPFSVNRIFAIFGVAPGSSRGGHAHRVSEQFLVMVAGGCTIVIDDGFCQTTERLDHPTQGLYVPPGFWNELQDFAPGSVCVALTSDFYDAADYIRDYAEFKEFARRR